VIKKKELIKKISTEIGKIEEIISVNFVGSFLSKSNFSDIDIVIIGETINKKIINKCHNVIKRINYKSYGTKKKILINDTFGPLKFNTDINIVFHLMIYSREDHIKHVINSPFTCYDWERIVPAYGKSLKDIYPVSKLFISDFFEKNRSINNYKKNLISRKINYKKYVFKKNKMLIKNLNYKIINKDIYEFCYHVISFSSKNYLKYITRKNRVFTNSEIINLIEKIYFKKKITEIIDFYKELIIFKNKGKIEISSNEAIKITLNFLKKFQKYLVNHTKEAVNVDFKRHLKTKYKKEIFLGQKINPPILKKNNYKIKKSYNFVYSSPSLRAKETSSLFSKKFTINSSLKEIDYGKVEGMTYKELCLSYPNIVNNWRKKKDIRFPKGESSQDIYKRVLGFLKLVKKFKKEKKYLIVTHNVFLRCLVGSYFDIPIFKWYLINIDYGENLNFKIINKKLFINIPRKKFRKIFQNIYENSSSNKT
tara:strand:+ start:796 stop:2235 length:1440 start_codon:yes stop_codon:yes gene_type:complete